MYDVCPLVKHTHTSVMFHITLRLYEEDAVLFVQLHVLLLRSQRRHAASLASIIKQGRQPQQ